jgi:hypothetical protein
VVVAGLYVRKTEKKFLIYSSCEYIRMFMPAFICNLEGK